MSLNPITGLYCVLSDDETQAVIKWDRQAFTGGDSSDYYVVLRTENANLQGFQTIGTVTTLDSAGYVDSIFVDGIITPLDPLKQYFYKIQILKPPTPTLMMESSVVEAG